MAAQQGRRRADEKLSDEDAALLLEDPDLALLDEEE